MSCSSVNTAALALHDPALGLPSCRRLLELQERLAGRTGKQQLETLADFLALDRRFSAATSVFSTCHHRARRAGAMFPATRSAPSCWPSVGSSSVADFDAAWSRGATRPWSELIGDLG